jgi:hypothetical protein
MPGVLMLIPLSSRDWSPSDVKKLKTFGEIVVSEETLVFRHIRILKVEQSRSTGEKFIHLKCNAPGCTHACSMSFRIHAGRWSAKDEELAGLFYSHCVRLVEAVKGIAVPAGQRKVTLSVGE